MPSAVVVQVRKMKMISPTNREVDIGQTLKPDEYIGMTRREVSNSDNDHGSCLRGQRRF